jgi:hypothetical protein
MTDAQRDPAGKDAPTETAAEPSGPASGASGSAGVGSGEREVAAFGRKAYGLATTRGFGNAMGRGFEMAITLLIMVGLGWLADSIFDTRPLFIIVFSVFGFAGTFVKLWIGYDLDMRKEEAGAIWNRKPEARA